MNCQQCKLREANFLERQMGLLPEARLKPAPAFNHIMLDLFVVIVADKNTLRGDYRLELVKEVFSKRKWKSAQSGYSVQ